MAEARGWRYREMTVCVHVHGRECVSFTLPDEELAEHPNPLCLWGPQSPAILPHSFVNLPLFFAASSLMLREATLYMTTAIQNHLPTLVPSSGPPWQWDSLERRQMDFMEAVQHLEPQSCHRQMELLNYHTQTPKRWKSDSQVSSDVNLISYKLNKNYK